MKLLRTLNTCIALLLIMAPAAMAGQGYGCKGGGKTILLLVGLALGYWVLTLAIKQKAPLNKVGKVIGYFIIVISAVGMLCTAYSGYCRYKCKKAGTDCGGYAKKAACGFHGFSKKGLPGDKK